MKLARPLKRWRSSPAFATASSAPDLEHYVRQSLFLLEEGASPQQVDRALTGFGMAMGIFAVGDLAGLDIAMRSASAATGEARRPLPRIADRVVELGRLGQKTGKAGTATSRQPRAQVDPEVEALIDAYRRELASPRGRSPTRRSCSAASSPWSTKARASCRKASHSGRATSTWCTSPATASGLRGGPMFYAESFGLRRWSRRCCGSPRCPCRRAVLATGAAARQCAASAAVSTPLSAPAREPVRPGHNHCQGTRDGDQPPHRARQRPAGAVTLDNFRLETVPLPALEEGQLLVRNRWLSLDPYMRGRMNEGAAMPRRRR